jgi:hypothetical protein
MIGDISLRPLHLKNELYPYITLIFELKDDVWMKLKPGSRNTHPWGLIWRKSMGLNLNLGLKTSIEPSAQLSWFYE